MFKARFIPALAILVSLGACELKPADESADVEAPVETEVSADEPSAEETVSILRPDIEQPDPPEPPLETLEMVIGFPEGGSELDAAATASLQNVLASEQVGLAGPIILRGHSDASGNDQANVRASRSRAERVRDWLVENGIAADRIEIIAFGEQNPAQPNALPDGSPNEEGRAANRRVEIEVPVAVVEPPEASVETSD